MTEAIIEIKNRIILLNINLLGIFTIMYYYKLFLLILVIISNPTLSNEILNYFIFTSITELFLIYILLGFLILKQITYFIILYHIICFLAAGLYRTEYYTLKYLFFICLMLASLCLCFFNQILVPIASLFFLSFQDNTTQSINFYFEAKIYDYLKFVTEIYFDCFLSFQLCAPLIFFTNYISNNMKLLKFMRKIFYLLILVFSTLTTPPDVFSQIFMFVVFLSGFEALVFINTLRKNLNFLTWQKTKTY